MQQLSPNHRKIRCQRLTGATVILLALCALFITTPREMMTRNLACLHVNSLMQSLFCIVFLATQRANLEVAIARAAMAEADGAVASTSMAASVAGRAGTGEAAEAGGHASSMVASCIAASIAACSSLRGGHGPPRFARARARASCFVVRPLPLE